MLPFIHSFSIFYPSRSLATVATSYLQVTPPPPTPQLHSTMSQSSLYAPPPIPPLWSSLSSLSSVNEVEDVQVREDGFLILKTEESSSSSQLQSQSQPPLLLHSAQVLLEELYPESKSLEEILSTWPQPISENRATVPTKDHDEDEDEDEDHKQVQEGEDNLNAPSHQQETKDAETNKKTKNGNGKDQTSSPDLTYRYIQSYQKLQRSTNLASRITSFLLDVAMFRHRPVKPKHNNTQRDNDNRRRDRATAAKVRTLELQQKQMLLKSQQTSTSTSTSNSSTISSATGTSDANDNDNAMELELEEDAKNTSHDDMDMDEEDEYEEEAAEEGGTQSSPREPPLTRMVRTINSLRAVTPHLLQIFHHQRRNDRHLQIGSVEYKNNRRRGGSFAWILGSQAFDYTSNKVLMNALEDLTLCLQGLIPVETARTLVKDPMGGSPEFWTQSWIPAIQARANPNIVDPWTLLTHLPDAPASPDILPTTLKECDDKLEVLLGTGSADATAAHQIQAQYDAAVRKLHQTVSKILKNRFQGARVSIYGSCLSNLSLGKGADVDLSLWLPQADTIQCNFQAGTMDATNYERQMKQFVFQVFHKLKNRNQEFAEMQPVTRARVPVVKGTYLLANNPYATDGSIK